MVRWHRERFRRYWTELSRPNRGPRRPRIDGEIRELISRHMPQRPANPDVVRRWLALLRNHKDGIAAMDFFTVPTASLRVLYCWFVIHHHRRRILHFNATFNPSAAWVIQQLREAFPYDTAPKYLIFDRDSIFSEAVARFVEESMGTKP